MKRLLPLLAVFFFVFIIGSVLFFISNSGSVSADTTTKNFVINQGDGLNTIATRLKKNGLINNQLVFLMLAYRSKSDNKLQAGLFKLSPSMTSSEIISKLSSGGSQDY
jgi:cell division protein YceG involved in septum cleavage